jgi:predicted AAA+ superfamily ATPase
MLAHVNGQTVNYSRLASSLDVSNATVKTYIDLLASTFMVELVAPWHSNLGKRLVKSPKVYLADSGLTAALLGLMSYGDILGHPASGAIWEQIVLSQIRGWFPQAEICFYRSAAGSEVDFVVRLGRRVFAIECKLSVSPRLSKGNHLAFADIQPDHAYVVIPTESGWPLTPDIHALSLTELRTALATST